MRHLVVKDGKIINVIEYNPSDPYHPPADHQLIAHEGEHDIGWHWDGQKAFDPNPKPEPGPLGVPIKRVTLNVIG